MTTTPALSFRKILFTATGLCLLSSAGALDEVEKRYIDRLAKGGPESIRDVAESMFHANASNTEVLDVAAEVMLQKYSRASLDFGSADAVAWLCKALAASGNNRYKAAVDEVAAKTDNRKLRGHCEKASKALKKGATDSYQAGTVDLQKLRDPPPAAAGTKPAAAKPGDKGKAAQPTAQAAVKTVDFSLIREGMSSQEVTDLLGTPTAQTSRLTGKQFRPFNFGARDIQRLYFLYKGVGRIEFSLKSAYEGVYRVITINADPNETGYP
jgi:hypothetical protein